MQKQMLLTIVVVWLAFGVHVILLPMRMMLSISALSLLFADRSHEPVSFTCGLGHAGRDAVATGHLPA